MIACYDLAKCPPTYDFLGFLLTVEQMRIDQREGSLSIRVLPGPANGFRRDRLPPFTIAERVRMRDGIVFPMADLLPSVRSCKMADRSEKAVGYGAKLYGTDKIVTAFRNGLRPLRAPKFNRPDLVTITLRESTYWPTRNANVAEWLKVAGWLKAQGLDPVIIRDTENADAPLDCETSPRASKDLHIRASLYATARLNLFVNNGPAWMAMAMDAPVLITKLIAPGAPCADANFFRRMGIEPGSQMPGCGSHQRILWTNDDADAVIDAARTML